MAWLMIFGCVIGAWAVLRIIGNERETRLLQLEFDRKSASKRGKA